MIRNARIIAAGRLDVSLRLRATDLRCEIAEQRQLLHHAEVTLRRLLCDLCRHGGCWRRLALLPLTQKLVRFPLRFRLALLRQIELLAIQILEQRESLLRRCLHETDAVLVLEGFGRPWVRRYP